MGNNALRSRQAGKIINDIRVTRIKNSYYNIGEIVIRILFLYIKMILCRKPEMYDSSLTFFRCNVAVSLQFVATFFYAL